MSSTQYRFSCFIPGLKQPCTVRISKTMEVGDLKKLIRDENSNMLAGIDAAELILYRVDTNAINPQDRINEAKTKMKELTLEDALQVDTMLSELYPSGPPTKTIHIFVEPPTKGVKRKASAEANDDIPTKRRHVLEDSLARSAPSDISRQEKYKRLNPDKFAFNRPPVPQSIPLAILHSIFGQFVEETESYEPTMEDYALVRGLQMAMSTVNGYSTEPQYCEEFRRVLCQHYPDVQLRGSEIGNTMFMTDGHLQMGEHMSSVCEAKLWDGRGDPEIQACAYLIGSLRHKVKRLGDYPDKFPSMIISIFGEYSAALRFFVTELSLGTFICFSGSVLTDRLHLETLTPAIPMHTNCHEDRIATQAARTLGAFRHAVQELQTYYTQIALDRKKPLTNRRYEELLYPYRCHYMDDNNKRVDFRYVRRLYDNNLLFLCQDSSKQNLCVKFTKRYSELAHQYCAEQRIAPKLYKVERLPGGWIMVVMEYLDEEIYEHLHMSRADEAALVVEVQQVVTVLHQGKLVHGDLRDINLLARRNWSTNDRERNVLLVDFDWAGREGDTYYPPNVNREGIFRPEGAIDQQLITRKHDRAMIHHMLRQHCPIQFTLSLEQFLASS